LPNASPNQNKVAGAIRYLVDNNHPLVAATAHMKEEDTSTKDAMDNLSGEIYSFGSTEEAMQAGSKAASNSLKNAMLNAVSGYTGPDTSILKKYAALTNQANANGANIWLDSWNSQAEVKGNKNAAKVESSSTGIMLGADNQLGDNLLFGLMAGLENGKIKNGGARSSELKVGSYLLGGYLSSNLASDITLTGGLTYSMLDYDAKRSIQIAPINGKTKASYKGYQNQLFIEGSKGIALSSNFGVAPYVGFTHSINHTDKIKETNNAAALEVKAQTNNVSTASVGARAIYQISGGVPIAFTANLGYQTSFGDTNPTTTHSFSGSTHEFKVQGASLDKNQLILGLGANADLSKKANVYANYDNQAKAATLGLGLKF